MIKIGKNNKNGNYYAIKIVKKAEAKKMAQVDHVLNEVKILSMLNHPFIVRILEYYSNCNDYFLVSIIYNINYVNEFFIKMKRNIWISFE